MKKIILSSTRASWQLSGFHGAENDNNKDYLNIRKKVLERDNYSCVYCGFKSLRWQELHHLDDNHSNNKLDNVVTTCPLCHQCYHLGIAGTTSGGSIIWLPEITQEELNHLVRTIFVAQFYDQHVEINQAANLLYETLKTRELFVEQNLAAGASDPGLLGQALLKMKPNDYKEREKFLQNLRLLPSKSRFVNQIDYWAKEVYKNIPPDTWIKLMNNKLK